MDIRKPGRKSVRLSNSLARGLHRLLAMILAFTTRSPEQEPNLRLTSTPGQQQDFQGSKEDVDIQADRDVLYVEQVVSELFLVVLDGDVVAAIDLRPPGSARLNQPALLVEGNYRGALLFVGRHRWTRTHKRDVALDNVKQLRQLIKPGATQPLAHTGDARVTIVSRGADMISVVFRNRLPCWNIGGIVVHGTELVEREMYAEFPDTIL